MEASMGLDKLIQPAQLLGLSSGPKFCECNDSHDIQKWRINEILDAKTIFLQRRMMHDYCC